VDSRCGNEAASCRDPTVRVNEEVDRLAIADSEQLGSRIDGVLSDAEGALGRGEIAIVPPDGHIVAGQLLPVEALVADDVPAAGTGRCLVGTTRKAKSKEVLERWPLHDRGGPRVRAASRRGRG
jgi:hypothetical protein